MGRDKDRYDVIILGTGLAGATLGAILAKAGQRVLLVDAASHPRFAVGESTVGYTLAHMRVLAHRYGVPEIAHMGSLGETVKHIGTSSGLKRHFGFMIHHEGQDPDPRDLNQFRLPKVLHQAVHYYRQDTDAYLFHIAIKYGCDARQYYRVEKVDLNDDGVTIVGTDGSTYDARYIVDASGFRSPIATQLGLREEPTRLKHHSRGIFTHMIGVDPLDDHTHAAPQDRPPFPWHVGTMHHMFERGWIWIIPFDNHKQSTNPLCSVGLQLDPRRYPRDDSMTAEEEFWHHVRRFPLVERQLARARSVREWVRTDRMQYSANQTVGHRWFLLGHAAGFVDPLFSRGMSNTMEAINVFAWRLLDALREDDFDPARFAYVEQLQRNLLDYNDKVVNSAFISWPNRDLWNTVYRIWAFGSLPGAFRVIHNDLQARRTGDERYWRDLEDVPNPGLWWPTNGDFKELFETMNSYCEAVDAGTMDPQDAADKLYAELAKANWHPPVFGLADRNRRFINTSPPLLAKMGRWSVRHAPPDMREYMVGTGKEAVKHLLRGKRIF